MTRDELSIVVLDDVGLVRDHIQVLLAQFGFKNVTTCSSVAEVWSALLTKTVHLILSDWHLGPPNGFDLLKELRTHPEYRDIAYIMITAEAVKTQVIQAVQYGVDDYLIKPLTPEAVQNKVYGVLLRKKLLS